MKKAALAFGLLLSLWPLALLARTTTTYGQNTVGANCNNVEKATDFDTIAQCNAGTGAGTMQTAPIILGTVTSPPYAATTCDANKAGMIQWTGTTFQGCNGTSWVSFGGASSVCNAPDAFSFTDQTGVAGASTITSNTVTLTGANFSCVVGSSCAGCTDIVKNGVSGGTTGVIFAPGDTIALRLFSSANVNTAVTAGVTVGGTTSSAWTVTTTNTDPCAGSPSAGTVCVDGTVYAGLSPDGNVKMYTTRCDAGMIWSESACTGTRSTYKWGTYGGATGYTSTTTGESNTSNLVANYGSYTDSDGTVGVPPAAYCDSLNANGRTDWYLPAKDELNVMYTNKTAIANFSTSYGWSSTEYSAIKASAQSFGTGSIVNNDKIGSLYVRCVRR